MDLIRYLNIFSVVLPLIYSVILLFYKTILKDINKKILNNGLIYICLFSFMVFVSDYFVFSKFQNEFILNIPMVYFNDFKLNLSFSIGLKNILYLVYTSFLACVFALCTKFYFKKFKRFIFTKQRFITLLSFSISFLYLFITCANLISTYIFWVLTGVCVCFLGIWDLVKNNINPNISRYIKISFFCDFCLLLFILTVFKCAFLNNLNYSNLNYSDVSALTNTLFQNHQYIVLSALFLLFILALAPKVFFFPFVCAASFLSGCSNLSFLTGLTFINSISSIFLFKNLITCFLFSEKLHFAIYAIGFLTIFYSLIFVLFEKNLKIILGHIYCVVNSLFIISFLYFKNSIFFKIYFLINSLILILFFLLFYFDKTEIPRRLINKNKGFPLESGCIFVFEKIPDTLFLIINFIDKKIIQNIINVFVLFFEYIISFFSFGNSKSSNFSIIKNILLMFGLLILFAIIIALFKGV